jgi:hypothetical protein
MRFHHNSPRQYRERTQKSLSHIDSVEYDISNSYPLPALLEVCDIHVTIDSSSVIEARDFSKRSVIINENGVFLYPDLIKEGEWVFPALSAIEFTQTLKRLFNKKADTAEIKDMLKPKSNTEIIKEFYIFIKTKSY